MLEQPKLCDITGVKKVEKNVAPLSKEKVIAYHKKWSPGEGKFHGTISGQCFFRVSALW